MCILKDGKIFEYHFFEDSAAFVEANQGVINPSPATPVR
jgi:hypothetical protein